MKFLWGFITGFAVGVVTALLLAPTSGEEMRVKIQTESDAQLKKFQEGVDKGKQSLQARMEQVSSAKKGAYGSLDEANVTE